MRILLWHGWLLTGSGSNVYNANVAKSWRSEGHDVLVMCQERRADELPFVDASGDLTHEDASLGLVPTNADPAAGSCAVLRPDIGGLLPVFVYDAYEGFEAKLCVDLTADELSSYVARNVEAMVAVIGRWKPDVIITGHEVMGPEIARRACEETRSHFIAKLHGSGLEYAVKLQPRYRRYASSGLDAAQAVVGGSRYMVRRAAEVIGGTWPERASVVNPGSDIELFKPLQREQPKDPVAAYVGKLIVSKGVHNYIAALGLTEKPVRSIIVGYGGFESALHALTAALRDGDLLTASEIARRGEGIPLERLSGFLSDVPHGYLERMKNMDISFTGRLEHGPLSEVLPTFDVLVVPSVLPEAFGMVAAEAAACGVLPIVPDHSGIAEAGAAVEEAIGAPGLLTFDPSDPIAGIASAIDRVLEIPFEERRAMGRAASALARERWSWKRVSRELLERADRA